jgi:NADH-quinone oxidoreductase subunit G
LEEAIGLIQRMSNTSTTEAKPAAPAAPPPIDKIKVKVDGREIEVPKTMPDPMTGRQIPTTMIQATNLAKVDVPHYCYHPKLPVAGNCRMCLVEFGTPAMGPDRKPVMNPDGTPKIAKSPRPAIACATPVSPGMEIYTATPGVKQMREGVLESLLINHPLDCPICDQAGECKLQEYSVEYGQAQSRFVEAKVHKPKTVDLGPRIVLDAERCILCTRCIRFTRDVAGDDALGIVNRGSYNTIAAFPGTPFANNYTLNTVDLCPVGALTSKDFRFRMRVWFLKETKSVCTSCGTGCSITIGSREEKIYRYEPRENDAVNSSWMCDAGRLNYKWVGRDDRLKDVLVRGRKTTWSNALGEISEKLRKATADSVAIVASARQANEELFLLKKIASKLNAITDSEAAAWLHYRDSLEGSRLLLPGPILDVGSGAGFPGLVLATVLDRPTTLVEPRRKRASFLRTAAARMGLANVQIHEGFSTSLPARWPNVVTRATFSSPADLLACRDSLTPLGRLLAWRSEPLEGADITHAYTLRGEPRLILGWTRGLDEATQVSEA